MLDRSDSFLKLLFECIYGKTLSSDTFYSLAQSKLSEIARGVAELSDIYTRRRQCVSKSLLNDPLLRRAYLIYFFPCNLFKLKIILKEILAHPKGSRFLKRERRLLDVGCGPGTQLLGFLDFLAEEPLATGWLDCVAVDSLRANLQDAQHLFEQYLGWVDPSRDFPKCTLQTYLAELSQGLLLEPKRKFDFIIFGNVLNELFLETENRIEQRCEVVSAIWKQWLAPEGFLILIEPALKETSRELLLLRDLLLEKSDLKMYSPCVHSLQCPAVARENLSDWCHEDRAWSPPSLIQKIDSLVGNRKSSLKYSYAVFNRMGLSVREAGLWQSQKMAFRCGYDQSDNPADLLTGQRGSQIWRVVSEKIEEKGKSSVYLCGSEGRAKVTRLKKHTSSRNEDFKRLDRGQVVTTTGLKKKNSKDWRVESETQLKGLM